MTSGTGTFRGHVTLAFCTLLHAVTHAYQILLVPLYLLMVKDLGLGGVERAALIVSVCSGVYFLLSYPAGVLTDRLNRKMLLGVGLIGNALAIGLLGATHQYWVLVCLAAAGGVFGSLFHPAANALVPAHYPKSPGMAVGLMGIGSGIGFFAGSQYAGWRAETVSAPWWGMSSWQVPCVEMGLLGVVVGILFLLFAREAAYAHVRSKAEPMGRGMRRRMLAISLILGCRDFAGVGTVSLVSVYLQKAHGFSTKETGWIIGTMGLISIVATPISVWMTGGRRRLPGLGCIVIAAGLAQLAVPHVAVGWILPVLAMFQVFHLSTYAVGEVALVELVRAAVRGRVIGLFLTVAGTLGASSPWIMGLWTDAMGSAAAEQGAYVLPFSVLGVTMILSSLSLPLLAKLGTIQQSGMSDAMLAGATQPPV